MKLLKKIFDIAVAIAAIAFICIKFGPQPPESHNDGSGNSQTSIASKEKSEWTIVSEKDKFLEKITTNARAQYKVDGGYVVATASCQKYRNDPAVLLTFDSYTDSGDPRPYMGGETAPPSLSISNLDEDKSFYRDQDGQWLGANILFRLDEDPVILQEGVSDFTNETILVFLDNMEIVLNMGEHIPTYSITDSTIKALVNARTLKIRLPVENNGSADFEIHPEGLRKYFSMCPYAQPYLRQAPAS